MRENSVDEILDLSTAFRIPNAPVGNGANVTAFDHFVERGAFVANPRDGFTQPGPPVPRRRRRSARAASRRLGSASTPTLPRSATGAQASRRRDRSEPSALPFEGLRVLDMTTLLGGAVVHARAGACSAPR